MRLAPSRVCTTSVRAASAGRPWAMAAASIASASRNTYAGPLPDTAVTASMRASSSIHTVRPALASTRSACWRWAGLTAAVAYRPVTPAPSSAGVLGIARTTAGLPPSQRSSCSLVMPAAMDSTSGCWLRASVDNDAHTSRSTCGLTASTHTAPCAAASAAPAWACTPKSACSWSRSACTGSATWMSPAGTPWRTRPAIRLRAMLPPPMKVSVDALMRSPWNRVEEGQAGRGRAPNKAVPIRTIVAPWAMASG
ncbi:hypothetical protein D3C71_1277870 [compost metagenome]